MGQAMRIALVTPAAARTRSGNRHTALRWAAFLRAAGHRVSVFLQWAPADGDFDLLLALHARRSHASILRFAESHPERPLVLALTGTDVYRDIHNSREAQESLALAHRFIVLQPEAIRALPRAMRAKARIVVQSCSSQLRHCPVSRRFRFCVIGNLRSEKDPLCALRALGRLDNRGMELIQLGEALDDTLAAAAKAAAATDSRYRWHGSVPHSAALRWLASSHAMVISSRLEGGANVVCEALRIGVPVLASRISGNIGLLGARYPAYFAVEDDAGLARLMRRTATDRAFYGSLKKAVRTLRPMVAPREEAKALLRALVF